MKEIWKDIAGYEGYQISNYGRFKNLKRNIIVKGRVLHNYIYHSFGRHTKEIGEHILVAMAFPEICGEWFEGAHVHHKDRNSMNNRADNLIVVSATEHMKLHYKDQSDIFKKPSPKRSASISAALKGRKAVEKHIPVECFSKDGTFVRRYECISDVTNDGFSAGNVCWCCKGKLKTAYGFVWRYAVNN